MHASCGLSSVDLLLKDLLRTPAIQLSQVDADAECNRIQVVDKAAREAQFQVDAAAWVGINPSREAIILRDAGASGGLLVVLKDASMMRGPGIPLSLAHPPEHGLLPAAQDGITRGAYTEDPPHVVTPG